MRVFVDGFGVLGLTIVRKLLENHSIQKSELLVNTYLLSENSLFLDFLKVSNITFFDLSYKELEKEILAFRPDYFLSVYGRRIIPQNILNLVKDSAINFHPSLLPDYKGCFSCPWVIINGETHTGITIHEMIEEVDAGKILHQEKVEIMPSDTAYSLYHRLVGKFASSFDEFFSKLINNELCSFNMPKGGTYYPRKVPYNGEIDRMWEDHKIDAFIRAMDFPPFKGAVLNYKNSQIEVNTLSQFKALVS